MAPSLGRAAERRSDWGFFECETRVEVDELSGCLAKVLVYHFAEVTRGRYVSICKPLEGADRTKFKCPMAKRMSPSEEVLTQYVLERLPAEVQGRSTPFRLMELGAGLGIAGLAAVAAIPNGLDVLLTDGDDKVLKSLKRTIVRNRHLTESPASTTIRAELLVWGREFDPRYRYFFHQIICADVVYSRDTHYSLQETIKRLLAPGGECWLFASKRLGSLEAFVDVCRSTADFEVVEVSTDFRCQNAAMRELRAMRCSPVLVRIVKGSSVQDRSRNLYDDVVALRADNLAAACARDILRHKRASQLRSFLARRSRARALERGAAFEASRGGESATAKCRLELKDIDLERLSVRILSVPGTPVFVAWPSHLPGLSKAERCLVQWLCSRLDSGEFHDKSVLFSGPFRLAPFVLSESSAAAARKVHLLPSAVEDAIAFEKVCDQFRGAVKVKLSVRGKYDIVWSFDFEAARYVKRGGQLFLGRGDCETTVGPALGDWTSIDVIGMVVVCRGKRVRVAAARRKGWASVVEDVPEEEVVIEDDDVAKKEDVMALHKIASAESVISETTATSSEELTPTAAAAAVAKGPSKWDLKTQTPHGGQEWSEISNLVEDFSVTTNGLGPVPEALKAAKEALLTIEHYPPSDFEPAITDLAKFLSPDDWSDTRSRLLLGNGASEMIDMISRLAPKGPWRPGPFATQYQEYRRSAKNAGRIELDRSDVDGGAKLTSIVNPCNPTGDYMHVEEIKEYISKMCDDNSWVVVDESMQPWAGPHWREDSLTSQKEFIQDVQRKRGISIYVIHSWTKIWACPGIRLGSVVCPTAEDASAIKKMQVPWSVNVMALHYLAGCCKADEYMEKTWKLTVEWRA
ncbi:hypothetical protein FOZ63_021117, partial [Perkinsus olseni]